jgi:GTPase SAR1 family protein
MIIEENGKKISPHCVLTVAGTFSDEKHHETSEILKSEAKKLGISYHETSAKTGKNVFETFKSIAEEVIDKFEGTSKEEIKEEKKEEMT